MGKSQGASSAKREEFGQVSWDLKKQIENCYSIGTWNIQLTNTHGQENVTTKAGFQQQAHSTMILCLTQPGLVDNWLGIPYVLVRSQMIQFMLCSLRVHGCLGLWQIIAESVHAFIASSIWVSEKRKPVLPTVKHPCNPKPPKPKFTSLYSISLSLQNFLYWFFCLSLVSTVSLKCDVFQLIPLPSPDRPVSFCNFQVNSSAAFWEMKVDLRSAFFRNHFTNLQDGPSMSKHSSQTWESFVTQVPSQRIEGKNSGWQRFQIKLKTGARSRHQYTKDVAPNWSLTNALARWINWDDTNKK